LKFGRLNAEIDLFIRQCFELFSCPQSVTPSDFIALDLSSSLTEFIVEMERSGGRMRIYIKGVPGFHPQKLMKTFWGCA